jgi:hypothetical protein
MTAHIVSAAIRESSTNPLRTATRMRRNGIAQETLSTHDNRLRYM